MNLGAGYDTFSVRQPERARVLKIVEIDHPATQAAKIEHFKRVGISFPSNVELVPVDLEDGDLRTNLAATSLDLSRPVFFACLGVLAYLRPETARKLFQVVSTLPKGSKMVIAFAARERGTGTRRDPNTADKAAAQGEPWLTRFDPVELRQELLNCAFRDIAFLRTEAAARRYYAGRSDLPAPRRVRLCTAAV